MKLPENYQGLTNILLNHIQNEPFPHTNVALKEQLENKIKGDEFGELIAYSLKNNLIYVNYKEGQFSYILTNKAKLLLKDGLADSIPVS